MAKTAVVFFSHTGNTKKLAGCIAKRTGADLFEIRTRHVYPANYRAAVNQTMEEIRQGFLPEIQVDIPNWAGYDTVFVGSPNWWSNIAPPVQAFIKVHDFKGKKLCPFCTNGGDGNGYIAKLMEQQAKPLICKPILGMVQDTIDEEKLEKWLSLCGEG